MNPRIPISEEEKSNVAALKILIASYLKFQFSHRAEMIKCVASVMLTLACLASVGTSKSLLADIKAQPSYIVIDSDGILGRYSPGADDNTFQMDCTGCFPEGRLISMKIRDVTDKCRGDTSDSKNKSVTTIYCPPCANYDLNVSAKVVIEGLPKCVNRTFEYRKDACPLNAQDKLTAQPWTSEENADGEDDSKAHSSGEKIHISAAFLLANLPLMFSVFN